jgi:hypothetical protein
MEAASRQRRTLRATICEIERGVFYAVYAGDRSAPATDELPVYQVGRSADDAKRSIERRAHQLGYSEVWWQESIIAPVFPDGAENSARKRAPALRVSRGV